MAGWQDVTGRQKFFCFPQRQEATGKLEDKNYPSVMELIVHVILGRDWYLSLSIRLGAELSVANCSK